MKHKKGKRADKFDPQWQAKERLRIMLCASNQTIDFVLYSYTLKKTMHVYIFILLTIGIYIYSTVQTCVKESGKDHHISNVFAQNVLLSVYRFWATVPGKSLDAEERASASSPRFTFTVFSVTLEV